MEGLEEWRFEGEIWRGMQNGGPFGGSAGDDFFTKPPNFGVEAHMEALARDALRATPADTCKLRPTNLIYRLNSKK
jgi:hypothetical protein